MTDDRAALVEKVARLLSSQRGWSWDWMKPSFKADQRIYATAAISIIRAEVLEEAAREMLTRRARWWPDEACATIRALKEKP